jgi:hypothetical protein
MTIVAGFCSSQGTILCADSEESGGFSKGAIDKIRIHILDDGALFAFAGAGWSTYIDLLEEELVQALKDAPKGKSEVETLRRATIRVHKKYIWPNPATDKYLGAVVVLQKNGRRRMLRIHEGVVTTHHNYVSVGMGWEVANYWNRFLMPLGCRSLSLDITAALAIFILWQVKKSVQGCGGPTSMAVFTAEGGFSRGPVIGSALESSFEKVMGAYSSLVGSAFNFDTDLDRALEVFSVRMKKAIDGPLELHSLLKEMKKHLIESATKTV